MSQIDWSKAPEWADSVWRGPLSGSLYWVEANEEKTQRLRDGFTGAVFDAECWEKIWGRPSSEWNGQGLPPVGTVCEAFYMGQPQGVVKVRYSGECMILWSDDRNSEQCGCADHYLFRPLRTTEQIAAEEREAAIEEMMRHSSLRARDGAKQVFGELYDAGYRKP